MEELDDELIEIEKVDREYEEFVKLADFEIRRLHEETQFIHESLQQIEKMKEMWLEKVASLEKQSQKIVRQKQKRDRCVGKPCRNRKKLCSFCRGELTNSGECRCIKKYTCLRHRRRRV